ncbi:lipopolysaccharide 1,3-galactosyltransferase [Shimwellia blattae DSM 4481 = NBRC 105725]|uniref:Lipopolysaccharide 1,3-galactosyltransferase n=1 Tax=Shimwellia blattae (strain ATCC 29907 / DSM 4481 / JCM 1650 / NBRC 105725 / CDC 9005-74) TaxID=630626 RepID=I2BEH6_SHIBC|nr:lipopolysaccharide 3-alpha-galactosyltransferase [Shimwellia blattae]AFJ48930.1 lipopolysaccharide 1,3-galactosyltransferase [Shimwellia blattae DSM 4481 = NBRC 105725]GAB81798.1 lipopolysaccharide 1,3-galactosyltransferase [Shimwellia blattae DSM 4481 = NBRC 105725]VEC28159.1 Lipopolysaccharide 1,2-glucosyltransferase [Shimwellia blattae]
MGYQYFNTDEMIKNTTVFDERDPSLKKESFHIAYGIDKNFLFGCGVSIASVLMNNREMDFVFHVFIDQLSTDDVQTFSQLAKSYKTCIQLHIVNCEKLKSFPTTKNWSVAMYFRFIIGDYFIGSQKVILYLDADIVCKGDISGLVNILPDDKVAGVVPERDQSWWEQRAHSLHCPALEKGYFNSGMLLLNIDAWAREYVSGRAMEMLSDKKITSMLSYMDQDILNLILHDKVQFIDKIYNTQFSLNYELKKTFINPVSDSTVFIHYVGPTKPWHSWSCYASATPFLVAREHSPWKDTPLMSPGNANYARYCAKHNFKQGKNIAGIINYIFYFYLKIKG